MILTKEIEVIATGRLLIHLRELGYKIKSHEKIIIPIEHLPSTSKKKVHVKCSICGIENEITYTNYLYNIDNGGYYSCFKCKGIKIKKTTKKKYGVDNVSQLDNIKNKKRDTLYKNYNTYSVFDINKDIIFEKYGVENVFQSEVIKEKIKKTNLERYGVENPQQNKEINEKTKKTCLEKYGTEYPTQNIEIKHRILLKNYEKTFERLKNYNIVDITPEYNYIIKCDNNHEHNFEISNDLLLSRLASKTILCTICNPINSYTKSGLEIQFINFIEKNYNGEIIKNSRNIIKPYELDIYLPELKIAFEFNGVYWHNELYKDKNYHYNKYKKCLNNNIQLFQFYEDDWINKNEIIKSMIINKLGLIKNKIYARKCEIKEINDENIVRNFLYKNHIQGYFKSSIKLGLFYNDELFSLMTFRKIKNGYELNRFCNIINYNIIGAASKLFNYFIKNYNFNNIISFSNNEYSNGNLYNILKFKKDKELKPDYSYIFDNKRNHKFNFRKDKLKNFFDDIDLNKTEHEICLENKIYRLYDSGKIKFVYNS